MSQPNSTDDVTGNVEIAVEELVAEESVESDLSYFSEPKLNVSSIGVVTNRIFYDEICTKHIPNINADLKNHPYFLYPPVKDPGINKALHEPEPIPKYADDGQDKYVFMCQIMDHFFVKKFHKNLLEDKIDLKYYGVSSNWMRAMCEALTNNKTVTYLDLTDNWLTTDACFHLGELIVNNKYLTVINLNGCGIGPEGARRLAEGIKITKKLKEIHLSYNELGNEGLEILAPVIGESTIKKYDLSHNNLKVVAGQELAKALTENKTLDHLDLSWNYMENKGIGPLLKALKGNPLQYLNLSWNGLVPKNIQQPLTAILKSPELRYFDVSNNMIKGDVLMGVSYFIFRAKKLENFKIGNNQLTTDDALVILRNFKNHRVTCNLLDLGNTNVTPEFVQEVENLKYFKTRKEAKVIYGNIIGNYTVQGPDPKLIAFKRAKFVSETKKKKDFGEFILRLHAKLRKKKPSRDQFMEYAKADGIILDNDLFLYLFEPFGTKKKVDVAAMAEYVNEIWPDTKLILTTVEEKPEAAPEKTEDKKDKNKGKDKGKKKK